MKKSLLLSLGLILLIFIGFASVLVIRAVNYGKVSEAAKADLPDVPDFDDQELAAILAKAIQQPTITVTAGDPRPGQDGPWQDLRAMLFESFPSLFGVAEKIMVADQTLLVRWQGSDASLDPILLMAHQDVVPVNMGTESQWDAPPFSGQVLNGYIYGRGALDDKSSLVSILAAADALVQDGFQPKRTIWMMFGHDEEVSGSGAQAGVEYFKSQGIRMEMVLDEGFWVIDPFPLTGGRAGLIGVSEKGYVTLQLTATAKGGHSSVPPRNSANIQLARALIALDENQMPADFSKPPLSDMMTGLGADMPFMQKLAFANLWLFGDFVESQFAASGEANAMIRTTTAPTMMNGSIKENVLPQRSSALVNFRIHPNDNIESVLAHVRNVIAPFEGLSADIYEAGGIGSEASPVSPSDNRAYRVLAAAARAAGEGSPVAPALVLGATDARWTAEISDNVYRFAPSVLDSEDLSGFHGTNERLKVENLSRMAVGYAQIMKAMASE